METVESIIEKACKELELAGLEPDRYDYKNPVKLHGWREEAA